MGLQTGEPRWESVPRAVASGAFASGRSLSLAVLIQSAARVELTLRSLSSQIQRHQVFTIPQIQFCACQSRRRPGCVLEDGRFCEHA
jgi:hypothetical protein